MTIQQVLSDLNVQMELARDEAEQARQDFLQARRRYDEIQTFIDRIRPTGEIGVINSEGLGSSCVILTRYYQLEGRMVLFTVTEALASNRQNTYIGQIVDYTEKTVLYAGQFYYDNFEEKQDLFDRLLANYTEWRFEL